MPKLPNQARFKELPVENDEAVENPVEFEQKQEIPQQVPKNTRKPSKTEEIHGNPEETPKVEKNPNVDPEKTEKPSNLPDENIVEINGQKIEIKPTKLKYFRNKTASAYNLLKNYSLPEVLSITKGAVDPNRDGDQIVFNFLIAALDDADFVKENYDDINADHVERIVNIFGRINHIDEKQEAQRKNREAQGNR